MDKNILKTVIADNQIEIPRYKVIPRDFTFEEFGNYVFTGIRRAGKSYLLYQRMQQLLAQGIQWDEMLYINFEDERLTGMKAEDLNILLEVHWKCTERNLSCFWMKYKTFPDGKNLHAIWPTPSTGCILREAMPGC